MREKLSTNHFLVLPVQMYHHCRDMTLFLWLLEAFGGAERLLGVGLVNRLIVVMGCMNQLQVFGHVHILVVVQLYHEEESGCDSLSQ